MAPNHTNPGPQLHQSRAKPAALNRTNPGPQYREYSGPLTRMGPPPDRPGQHPERPGCLARGVVPTPALRALAAPTSVEMQRRLHSRPGELCTMRVYRPDVCKMARVSPRAPGKPDKRGSDSGAEPHAGRQA